MHLIHGIAATEFLVTVQQQFGCLETDNFASTQHPLLGAVFFWWRTKPAFYFSYEHGMLYMCIAVTNRYTYILELIYVYIIHTLCIHICIYFCYLSIPPMCKLRYLHNSHTLVWQQYIMYVYALVAAMSLAGCLPIVTSSLSTSTPASTPAP